MEIKPKFNTGTIRVSAPIKKEFKKNKIVKDPEGVIPNGIFKVIRWEKIIQSINMLISGGMVLAMTILITLYATAYKTGAAGFIIPIVTLLASSWKLINSVLEYKRLFKEVSKYREDVKIGLTSQPPLIIRLYRNMHMKQVSHNWATFFLIFNIGIFTLLLWWLKDASWWIFDFKKWISHLFSNPSLMITLFTIALIFISIIHIYFAIQRKKRTIEIESYFGETVIPASEIDQAKAVKNKFYRRLFMIYIMVLFIIPLVVKVLLRVFRKK